MKVLFAMTGLFLGVNSAFADGFVCQSERDNLVVRVYNQTAPEAGTRNAAVMVVSDSSVQFGNKTIAKFSEANSTLTNEASTYVANVDHRFNDSGRKGELIAGTKIGYLKTIILDVAFTYARPLAAGALIRGDLTLIKRNGDKIAVAMDCSRYLKN